MDTLTLLIEQLYAPDHETRCQAARALGALGDPRAIEELVAFMNDHSRSVDPSTVKFNNVWDYEYYGEQPSYGPLVAIEALATIGTSAVVPPLLDALLHADDPDLRRSAASALGKVGDTRAVEPLIQALSEYEEVRNQAAISLGELHDLRAFEPLVRLLPNQYAARALGKLGDSRAVEPLMVMVAKKSWNATGRWEREAAIEALGELGDQRAIDLLHDCLEAEDTYLQSEDLYIQREREDPYILNHHRRIRDSALRALRRLGVTTSFSE